MNPRNSHPAVRLGLLPAAIALALVPAFASAQDTQAAPAQETTTTLDRIEVTGSRIRRAELETAQPIITITREQIEQQGFLSVADMLQNLPSAGSPAISRADSLAAGENVGGYYIDLRNLGTERTLVLLNGKRLGVTTSGLQDLQQIPTSAIERIEVLGDGASAIYGSDAIAGVVNVITRRNFNGAEANAYIGQFDQGDGFKEAYDFTIGVSNDRASLTLSAEYVKEDPVYARDREFSSNTGPNFPNSAWSLISQNGVWLGNVNSAGDFTAPGCASGLCTLNPGEDPTDPNNYHDITNAERSNANEKMLLQTGTERRNVFITGDLQVTDNVRFRAELGYNERETFQQNAGYPFGYQTFGTLISEDSFFNPNPEAGDAYFFRRTWEVPRQTRSELDTLRVDLGLEGVLDFADKPWDWNVGFLSLRSDSNKYDTGNLFAPSVELALGPSYFNEATGRVECGSAAAPIAYGSSFGAGQCIPWNPLLPAGQEGQGSLSDPALQAFLFPEYHDIGRTETTIYSANLAGPLFTLPAGDLSMAVGLEHRKESGIFVPDAAIQAGLTSNLLAATTQGSYDVSEAYAEFDIPVLADAPFAQELTFNVASRYSDYSNFGETLNSKFSVRWRPVEDLLVRATYAEGFRAPSIDNLFGGTGSTYSFYTDPCSTGEAAAGSAACAADGVPEDYVQIGQGGVPCTTFPCQTGVAFLTGSNPDLTAEESESTTIGLVWSGVEGLDVTLDWWNYTIDNAIVAESPTGILDDCYVFGIQSQCDRVVRDADGVVVAVDLSLDNAGIIETEGYDLGVNYRFPESAAGKFRINWQTTYTSKYDTTADDEPGTPTFGNVGFAGLFRIRSNFGVNWERGDYSVSYTARYYSGIKEACSANFACSDPDHLDLQGNPDALNRLGSNTFHDLQFAVKLPWNATASIGANNITDHVGPILRTTPNSEFAYYGGFDIGRFWYMQYKQRF